MKIEHTMSFVAACKHFFGLKSGQTSTDFMKEVKQLDDNDRAYFKKEFLKVGYEITT